MTLTPADIRNKQFGIARFRSGYIDGEVDEFLDVIEAQLVRLIQENEELRGELATVVRGGIPRIPAPRTPPAGRGGITANDVRNKRFGVSRLHPGYVDEEVDDFLIEVEAELDRLTQENAELRARLTEYSRGWEQNPRHFDYTEYDKPSSPALAFPPPQASPLQASPLQASPLQASPLQGSPLQPPSGLYQPPQPSAPQPPAGFRPGSVPAFDQPYESYQPPRRQRRQWLEADAPVTVPLYSEVGVAVRVCGDASDNAGGGSYETHLRGSQFGRAQFQGTQVTLIAQARFELTPTAPLRQVVPTPESGNSETVRFTFHATYPGHYSIRVSAFAGGTFLGDLTVELSVEQGGRLARGSVRTATLAEARAVPGEVTLQVRSDGAEYIFQFLSEMHAFEPALARELASRPSESAQRVTEALRTGHGSRDARTLLARAGAGLWHEMVPDLIKDQFWQLRDSVTALNILCEQDILPWELLFPVTRGEGAGFLTEQFPVLRRSAGQHPARQISLAPPLFAMPADAPGSAGSAGSTGSIGSSGSARQEVAALQRRLGLGGEGVDDMDRLLDLIDAGEFGLLHFACHDTFVPDPSGSSIKMGGGRLIPAFLNRAATTQSLASHRSLVFVNSSRSNGTIPEYTRLTGWAEQFMTAGAGAFVGASWPVLPTSATGFAEAFYEALREGHPLGLAASTARKAVAADGADPAWLAYSVYGDPAASVDGLPA